MKYNFAKTQYSFRRTESTTDPLGEVTFTIRNALKNSMKCWGIFIELSIVFDPIHHSLIIENLGNYKQQYYFIK